MPESKGREFRRLLKEEPYQFTGGVYEPLGAQIAERVGMKSIYLSGYSMALHNAWPDMGFLTQTEVARIASMVASATSLPVIADADDGYGNALSTIRTVQEFMKTGVAGIHLEDQRFPKRCGHIAGKTVVSLEEALGKYRAALDTRDRLDPDFVIIARTDAYGAVGGSLEEAIRRVGLEPKQTAIRGGTDGSALTEMGLLSANLFTGGHDAHSEREWICVEDMGLAAATLVELAGVWAEQ